MGSESLIFVSGQAAISAEGRPVGECDFEAQAEQVFESLQAVLSQAGAGLGDIVKLTVYLTEIGRLRECAQVKARFSEGRGGAARRLPSRRGGIREG